MEKKKKAKSVKKKKKRTISQHKPPSTWAHFKIGNRGTGPRWLGAPVTALQLSKHQGFFPTLLTAVVPAVWCVSPAGGPGGSPGARGRRVIVVSVPGGLQGEKEREQGEVGMQRPVGTAIPAWGWQIQLPSYFLLQGSRIVALRLQ